MLKTLLLCLISCIIAGLIIIAYSLLVELGKLIISKEKDRGDE